MADVLPNVEGDRGIIHESTPVYITGGSLTTAPATPATPKTPTTASVSGAGSTTVGACSITIANIGDADGTVGGATLEPGQSVSAGAEAGLTALAYDATGTTFFIVEVN